VAKNKKKKSNPAEQNIGLEQNFDENSATFQNNEVE